MIRLQLEKRAEEQRLAAEMERKRHEEELEKRRLQVELDRQQAEAERKLWVQESRQISLNIITCLRQKSEQYMKLENKQRLLSYNQTFNIRNLFE